MYTVKTAKLPEDVRVALHVVTELELLFSKRACLRRTPFPYGKNIKRNP